jgi:hypothetical protein
MDPALVEQQAQAEAADTAARALAARLGMTTADTLPAREVVFRKGSAMGKTDSILQEVPPSRAPEYVDETPKRARRGALEIEAEDELDHHWVTLLSIERPVPRHWGDNHGMLPIWVESNADWRQAGRAFDLQQPAAATRAVRLAVLGVRSAAHAGRLKAALDEALVGRATAGEADTLRHRFRNGVDLGDIDVWWTPLLQDALIECELAAAGFEVFTRAEHDGMVAARVAAKLRRHREGR